MPGAQYICLFLFFSHVVNTEKTSVCWIQQDKKEYISVSGSYTYKIRIYKSFIDRCPLYMCVTNITSLYYRLMNCIIVWLLHVFCIGLDPLRYKHLIKIIVNVICCRVVKLVMVTLTFILLQGQSDAIWKPSNILLLNKRHGTSQITWMQ